MVTKAKKKKSQSHKKSTKPKSIDPLARIDKIVSHFSLKQLHPLIDKKDMPQIIALAILLFIFTRTLPHINSNDKLFGVDPIYIFVSIILITLVIIIFLFRRNDTA